MSGKHVHGPQWRDDWDDSDRAGGHGVYGCAIWLALLLAILLVLGAWAFANPAQA